MTFLLKPLAEKREVTMSKLGLIINREYSSRVKKKSFLVLTILVPLLAVGFMFGAMWLTLEENKQVNVLVADPGGWCGNEIYQDTTIVSPVTFYFYNEYVASTNEFLETARFDKYDVLVMLNEEVPANRKVSVVYKEKLSLKNEHYIQNRIESRLMEYFALKKTNISKKQYDAIKQPFDFKFIDGEDPEGTDYSGEQAAVGFAFAILTYMFIFVYSMQVMKGVIEEKTNRVIEVLISSVKPFQLMMGKIIGIGLVGLTQFLIWLVLSGVGLMVIRMFAFTDMSQAENWDVNAMNNGMIQ